MALSLSGDMEKLTALHTRFGERMMKSSYGDIFRVISPEGEYTGENFLDLATKSADIDSF